MYHTYGIWVQRDLRKQEIYIVVWGPEDSRSPSQSPVYRSHFYSLWTLADDACECITITSLGLRIIRFIVFVLEKAWTHSIEDLLKVYSDKVTIAKILWIEMHMYIL